jgi:hypothetical protein
MLGFGKKDEVREATMAEEINQSGVQLTQEQLKDLMTHVARAIGEEMRRPTPEQEAKAAEEKARAEKMQAARIEVGKTASLEAENRKRACAARGHRMDNGRSEKMAIGSQLCSDGKVHVFCVACASEIRVYTPSAEQLQMVS